MERDTMHQVTADPLHNLRQTVARLGIASQALWWRHISRFIQQVRADPAMSALLPADATVEDLLDPSQVSPEPQQWAHRAFLTLERYIDPKYGRSGSRPGQLREGKWGNKWDSVDRAQNNELYIQPIVAWLEERLPQLVAVQQHLPPPVAPRFEFHSRLGAGGYADVWRARDVQLGRDVAIKVVRESAADISSALDHARALARVNHPNVVTVHEVAPVDDPESPGQVLQAVVTELVEGETLCSRLQRAMGTDEARLIGVGVLGGLAAIHEVGLVHQDLHDENVLVGSTGVPKIIDILYRGTVAVLPPTRREHHLRTDVRAVGEILRALIDRAAPDHAGAEAFRRLTRSSTTLEPLSTAFVALLGAPTADVPGARPVLNLLHRFSQGAVGERRLVEQLMRQPVVANDAAVAEALSAVVALRAYEPGGVLMMEDAVETEMHMLLVGEVAVEVHGREVARRVAPQHVGEMAVIDPSRVRSATVRARAPTVTAVVSEEHFTTVATSYPVMWRRLALELAERLRGRGAIVQPRNERPQVYVSTTGTPSSVASAAILRSMLADGPWQLHASLTVDALMKKRESFDLAVFVATAGDSASSERDSILAQVGLMMGALGSDRTSLVLIGCSKSELHLPWISGIRYFEVPEGTSPLEVRLLSSAEELRTLIPHLGSK